MDDRYRVLYLLDYTDLGGGEAAFLALMQELENQIARWIGLYHLVILAGDLIEPKRKVCFNLIN